MKNALTFGRPERGEGVLDLQGAHSLDLQGQDQDAVRARSRNHVDGQRRRRRGFVVTTSK